MSRPITLDSQTKDRIAALYSSGLTGRAIAAEVGYSHHVVFAVLKERGLVRAPIAPQKAGRKIDPQIIKNRWAHLQPGARFDRLEILRPTVWRGTETYCWCRCDCGRTVYIRAADMRRARSCGCLKPDLMRAIAKSRAKHGHARRSEPSKGTPEYRSWCAMRRRCYNPKSTRYEQWGGRGIKVCPQWLGPNGFAQFLADMGRKPSPKHSIDRVDNDGHYEPGNCRWATKAEQSRNRRNVRK